MKVQLRITSAKRDTGGVFLYYIIEALDFPRNRFLRPFFKNKFVTKTLKSNMFYICDMNQLDYRMKGILESFTQEYLKKQPQAAYEELIGKTCQVKILETDNGLR